MKLATGRKSVLRLTMICWNRSVLPNFLDCNDLEYFKLYFQVECMLYSLVLKNVIASHDVAEEALIYSYGTSFNGFKATLTSKSAKFPNSSWLCVVQFGDIRFCES